MIYITAGHSPKHGPDYDPGAIAKHGDVEYKEADLAVIFRDKVVAKLKTKNAQYTTDQDDWNLSETIAGAKTQEKDVVFDIHFNAAGPTATGTEIFIADQIPGKTNMLETAFAKVLLDGIYNILKLPKRGVKFESQCRHKKLGIMRPKGANFLVELCFITNKRDLEIFFAKQDEVASFVADTLYAIDEEMK